MLDENMSMHPSMKEALEPYKPQEDVKEFFA